MNNNKFERLKQKKAEIQALRKQMQEESNKIFGELTKEFFDENPKLESFAWTQYTPYFNDGDTCEFQANTDYIYVNGEYIEDCEWYDKNNITNYGRWNSALKLYEGRVEVENPDYDEDLAKVADEIKLFLSHFEEDFFKEQFGDHNMVTVTKSGVDTDYYEHD